MRALVDKLSNAWMIISTIFIGVLIFLYHRRGQKLEQVVYELQKQTIEAKLKAVKERGQRNEKEREKAKAHYADLRRRYAAAIERHGIEDGADGGDGQ